MVIAASHMPHALRLRDPRGDVAAPRQFVAEALQGFLFESAYPGKRRTDMIRGVDMSCDLAGSIGARITGPRGEETPDEPEPACAPRETIGRCGTAIRPMGHRP